VRTSRTASVRNLDLKAFTLDAVGRGYINRSWYLSGVEAGFEIWRDGAGLASESFSVIATQASTPLPTVQPSPTITATASGPPACSLRWRTNVWNTGLVASVIVTNNGPPLRGWSVSWSFGADERIDNDWGVEITQAGRRIVAGNAAYNAELDTGDSATFGFQASHGGSPKRPAEFRLNGKLCAAS
jgi:hypothetical protein